MTIGTIQRNTHQRTLRCEAARSSEASREYQSNGGNDKTRRLYEEEYQSHLLGQGKGIVTKSN
jgi:hypothetical protein